MDLPKPRLPAKVPRMDASQSSPGVSSMLPQGTSFMTPQGVTQKAYLRSVMVPSSNPNGVYFVKDASGKVFQCKTVRSANETPIQIHPNSAAANHGKGVQIITSGNVPVFVKSATPLKMANCLPMKVGPEKKEDELKSSEVRDMLKTLLDINTRRLHAEQVRFNYEERVGCQILDLLGKIVPKEDKENE